MNLHFVFNGKETQANVTPCVTGVFNYPLKRPSLKNSIVHRGWTIECHTKDAGRVRIGADKPIWFKRPARMVHLFMPGTVFQEDTRKVRETIEQAYIGFEWQGDCKLGPMMHPTLRFAAISDPEDHVAPLVYEAARLCQFAGNAAFWEVQAILAKIVGHLLQASRISDSEWELKSEQDRLNASSFSDQVESYLRHNIARQLNIADIAGHMRVSESLLNHKFKAETGTSPLARFSEIRTDAVKQLLLKGKLLKEIAEMLGYCDEFYLSNTFKKATGLSPRQFKNQTVPPTHPGKSSQSA